MDTLTLEQRMQLAIEAFQPSKRSAANAFNVPWTNFRNRLAGIQPNRASKQHMQHLTLEEEGALYRVLQQMHLWVALQTRYRG